MNDVAEIADVTSGHYHANFAFRSSTGLTYDDWLDTRSDLWTAGASIQREIFAAMLTRSLVGPAKQDPVQAG